MAGTPLTFQGTGTIASPKSTGTSTMTIFEATAPANQAIYINNFKASFDGTASNGPQVLIEPLTNCTAGQGTASALTLTKSEPEQSLTIQTTAKEHFTVEGTHNGTAVPGKSYEHPQTRDWVLPRRIRVPAGKAFRVRVTVGTAVNYMFTGELEE